MKEKTTYQSTLNIKTSKYSIDDALKLFKQDKFIEALEICQYALKYDENYQFLNLKGQILSRLKNYKKAIVAFDEALKLNASDEIKLNKANTLYNWAKKLHFPDYNNKKALEVIDEAIELLNDGNDISEFWFLKAEILEGLGDNIEARKYYYKAEGQLDKLEDLQNQINSFKKYSNDTLINITGYNFYKGIEIFKEGLIIDLVKDPTNEHDSDAVAAILNEEVVGYVANSDYSVIDEVKSASEIKNIFDNSIKAEILFIYLNELVIARLKDIN